ncbi:hypothetical protein BC827DRAFT_211207 [Russula dissimulans]|nr:hypothetical protein BC827DRAFT_211207 [Russula dissimulans]
MAHNDRYTHAVNSVSQVELCSSTALNLKTFTYTALITSSRSVLQLPILSSVICHAWFAIGFDGLPYPPASGMFPCYICSPPIRTCELWMSERVSCPMTTCKRPET